jgi:hypothetical protein
MIQDFTLAKTLSRAIAKKYNLKSESEWRAFTHSPDFEQKANVMKRKMLDEEKIFDREMESRSEKY